MFAALRDRIGAWLEADGGEKPDPRGVRRFLRLFALLLPAAALGTLLLHGIVPRIAWDDAAAVATTFAALSLAFIQWTFETHESKDPANAFMPLLTPMGRSALAAGDYDEARELSRRIQRHLGRWAAGAALIAAAIGALIHVIVPSVSWREAFILSVGLCAYLVMAVASPWYGYRKWTRSSTVKTFALLSLLTAAGVLIGIAAPNARPLSAIDPTKALRAVAIALALSFFLTSLIVGISRMRLREADQRAARLAAEAERERLGRQNVQAELKLLQAQVEPHFLFNTLANVRHLMGAQPSQAVAMLDHLIQYLRTALPEIRTEGSTLGRETELVRAYLEIMKLRMGGSLDVVIDVPEDLRAVSFPSLMLITLAENAIKHGVAPAGGGRVSIRASAVDGKLRVAVEDDGPGLGGTLGSGVGLANLRERLAALFGGDARLDLESQGSRGARACIEVPLP